MTSYHRRLRKMLRQQREGEMIIYHCHECMAMRLHKRTVVAGVEHLECMKCGTIVEFVL